MTKRTHWYCHDDNRSKISEGFVLLSVSLCHSRIYKNSRDTAVSFVMCRFCLTEDYSEWTKSYFRN